MSSLRFALHLATALVLALHPLPAANELAPPPAGLLPLKPSSPLTWEATAYELPPADQLANDNWKSLLGKLQPRRDGRKVSAPPAMGSPAPTVSVTSVPLSLRGAYDGRTTRLLLTWSDGKTTEKWILPGFILEQSPIDGAIMITDQRLQEADVQKLGASPFAELFWLQSSFYRSTRAVQGKPCYFYQATTPPRFANSWDVFLSPALTAWIDPATRLPYAGTDGDSLWVYHYLDGAPGPLTLPPAFQSALDQSEKRYQRLIGRYKAVKP